MKGVKEYIPKGYNNMNTRIFETDGDSILYISSTVKDGKTKTLKK